MVPRITFDSDKGNLLYFQINKYSSPLSLSSANLLIMDFYYT